MASSSGADSAAFLVTEEEMDCHSDKSFDEEDGENRLNTATTTGSEATWKPKIAKGPTRNITKTPTMPRLDEEDSRFVSRSVEANAAEEMYMSIIYGGSCLKGGVQEWIALYAVQEKRALATLFQFICCCCRVDVSFEKMSLVIGSPHLLDSTLTDANWVSTEYLMSITKYASNLEEFWKLLWIDLPEKLLFDGVFFENLLEMFQEMCVSQVRPVRHTAAVAAMSLMPELESYRQLLKQNKERTRQSYSGIEDAEIRTINKRVSMLDEYLKMIFDIFHNSCRDRVTEVRKRCLTAMGELIRLSPRRHSGKISYFGPALGDGVDSVRLTTLETLVTFLELGSMAEVMTEFIADHKDQIENLMYSISKVSKYLKPTQECIVRLIVFLHRQKRELISLTDRNLMYSWISLKNETAACFAGDFVLNNYRDENDTFDIFHPDEQMLLHLANYFTQTKTTDVEPYMKNLVRLVPSLHDWNFMCNLLLKTYIMEHSLQLTSVFVCAIKKIATENGSSSKDGAHQLERKRMMHCVLKFLPRLMSSFDCDSPQMEKLTKIITYFEFPSKMLGEDRKNVEELLRNLTELVKKVRNVEVFDSCIKGACTLSKAYDIKEDAEEAFINIAEDLKAQYIALLFSVQQITTEEDLDSRDTLDDFIRVGKKVEKFLCFRNFVGDLVLHRSLDTLKKLKDEDVAPNVIRIVLSIAWLSVGGILNTLLQKFNGDVARRLRGNATTLADFCCAYLTNEKVADKAFVILCYILNHFTESLLKNDRKLEAIVITANKNIVEFIDKFMNRFVFKDMSISGVQNVDYRIELLKSYLSLVENGCISLADSGPIFRNMFKFNSLYGETMKESLLRLKSADKLIVAEIFCSALISAGHSAKKGIDNWIQDHVQDLGKLFASLVYRITNANRDIVKEVHISAIKLVVESKRRSIIKFILLNQMPLFPIRVEADRQLILQFAREEFEKLEPGFVNRSANITKYMDLLNTATSPGGPSETSSPAAKKPQLDSRRSKSRRSLDFSKTPK